MKLHVAVPSFQEPSSPITPDSGVKGEGSEAGAGRAIKDVDPYIDGVGGGLIGDVDDHGGRARRSGRAHKRTLGVVKEQTTSPRERGGPARFCNGDHSKADDEGANDGSDDWSHGFLSPTAYGHSRGYPYLPALRKMARI